MMRQFRPVARPSTVTSNLRHFTSHLKPNAFFPPRILVWPRHLHTTKPPFKTNPPPHARPTDLEYAVDIPNDITYKPRRKRKSAKTKTYAPSPEQHRVITLSQTHHVVVSARPGSGKTATAEAIVASNEPSGSRIALLTYSRRLKIETEERFSGRYDNVDVWTFHGMAGKIFGGIVPDDAVLLDKREALDAGLGMPPRIPGQPFDVIILDEFQDCTELLFWLVCVFIEANTRARGKPARLVILGDEKQAIYEFKGADARYLTLASKILKFNGDDTPWAEATMSTSFRMSHQTADFVKNVYMAGDPYVSGAKDGLLPIFMQYNPFEYKETSERLIPLISYYGAKNTAILVPSVCRNVIIAKLSNWLTARRVPISVPIDDDTPLDRRTLKGKLSISTIHQFKGSERDLIIVIQVANQSYFKYFDRSSPDLGCTNALFVALTRARQRLVVLFSNHGTDEMMGFLDPDEIAAHSIIDYTEKVNPEHFMVRGPAPGRAVAEKISLPRWVRVRALIRHLDSKFVVDLITKYLDITVLQEARPRREHIVLPPITSIRWQQKKQDGDEDANDVSQDDDELIYDEDDLLFEAVYDLNALVVVAATEHAIIGTLKTIGLTPAFLALNSFSFRDMKYPFTQDDISWLCRKACQYNTRISLYHARKNMLDNSAYRWIKPGTLNRAVQRLAAELARGRMPVLASFETRLQAAFGDGEKEMEISGAADIVTVEPPEGQQNKGKINGNDWPLAPEYRGQRKTLWEIKFTESLNNNNILQTAIYSYLFARQSGKLPEQSILFNIRSGEKLLIREKDHNGRGGDNLEGFMEELVRAKYTVREPVGEAEFVKKCWGVRRGVREAFDRIEERVRAECEGGVDGGEEDRE